MSVAKFLFICALVALLPAAVVRTENRMSYDQLLKKIEYLNNRTTISLWKKRIARTVVSLTPRNPYGSFGSNHFCNGVLITPRHVLTAGACLLESPIYLPNIKVLIKTRNLIVVAGGQYRLSYSKELTKRIRAKSYTIHLLYLTRRLHNLGVIELDKPFPVNTSAINIANLPNSKIAPGDNCVAFGWGRVYPNGPLANELKVIHVTMKSFEECRKKKPDFYIGDICGFDDQNRVEVPCQGDMGAPLFCNGILQGIVSFTGNCGKENPMSIFTEVYHNKNWIESIIKEGNSSACPDPSGIVMFAILGIYICQRFLN